MPAVKTAKTVLALTLVAVMGGAAVAAPAYDPVGDIYRWLYPPKVSPAPPPPAPEPPQAPPAPFVPAAPPVVALPPRPSSPVVLPSLIVPAPLIAAPPAQHHKPKPKFQKRGTTSISAADCKRLREAVATYGAAVVEMGASMRGYTAAQVVFAKRACGVR